MQVARKLIFDELSPFYPKQEIEGLSRLIFEKVFGLTPIQVHLNEHKTISAANLVQIKEILNRLIQFEPIQYILGETEFYGLCFSVNSSVLIPRPETEELVDWIINDHQDAAPTILDLGTGSGCIAITLAKNLAAASATGWDISAEALSIARENALKNQVEVGFYRVDILKSDYPLQSGKYDILVSNPPYVTNAEQALMRENVINYEPHLALFVPDTDPLIFYRAISKAAFELLKPGGNIYFEINEKLGAETVELLTATGFKNIRLRKDIHGKDRMIKGENPYSTGELGLTEDNAEHKYF